MIKVVITFADFTIDIFDNVKKSGPSGNFFLIGLEDKTILIPSQQILSITVTEPNQEE